jgi:hypothetical protein
LFALDQQDRTMEALYKKFLDSHPG